MKQIMLVADVDGSANFHAGDEAILTARLALWRDAFPQIESILLSKDPAYTSIKHKCRSALEFNLPSDFEVKRWFFRLHRIAPQVARKYILRHSPANLTTLQVLHECGVLHICGGGNLRSGYQRLLWNRSFLAMEAQAHYIPVVVTGVQIGPDLAPVDRRVLSQWLPRCEIVGVRDDGVSRRLAKELGVPSDRLIVTGDDAIDLATRPPPTAVKHHTNRPLIGLSIHQEDLSISRQRFLAQLVSILKPWLQACEADVVLLPHRYSVKPTRDDIALAREFNREMGEDINCLGADFTNYDERVLKHLSGECQFVLTTRFHAAVFALTQGVPVCAIAQNDYTAEKFNGLLRYFTLETKALNINQPDLGAKIQETWQGMPQTAIQVRAAMAKTLPKYQATWASITHLIERLIENK